MKKLFFALTAACTIFAGCSNDEPDLENTDEIPDKTTVPSMPSMTQAETLAANGQIAFGTDFFAAVSREYPRKNVVTSPMSASMLLSMLANAADATTRAQICTLLDCTDSDALNSLYGKYTEWLSGIDENLSIFLANALWYRQEYTLNPAFSKILNSYYDSETFGRDFSNKASLIDEINKWTDLKTRGIIDHIIDDLDPDTKAVLANALYFKGSWRNGFDAENTRKANFHGIDGDAKVDMMNTTEYFSYASAYAFEAVEMAYGLYGQCYMTIIMPKKGSNLDEFIASADFRSAATTAMKSRYIDLSIPKFSVRPDERIALNSILATMGVDNIESENNWTFFTDAIETRIKVYQKAGITVDEYGTEAAAVTWTEGETSSGYEVVLPTPIEVRIDRPFVFLIRERSTGLCLFAGKVNNL